MLQPNYLITFPTFPLGWEFYKDKEYTWISLCPLNFAFSLAHNRDPINICSMNECNTGVPHLRPNSSWEHSVFKNSPLYYLLPFQKGTKKWAKDMMGLDTMSGNPRITYLFSM